MPPSLTGMRRLRPQRSRCCLGRVRMCCGDAWKARGGRRYLHFEVVPPVLFAMTGPPGAKSQKGRNFDHKCYARTSCKRDPTASAPFPHGAPTTSVPQQTAALQELARSCGLVEKIQMGQTVLHARE